jgi:hypothetical protein
MKPRALRDLRTDSREMRAPSSKNHGSEAQRQGYGTGSVLASYPGYARERREKGEAFVGMYVHL